MFSFLNKFTVSILLLEMCVVTLCDNLAALAIQTKNKTIYKAHLNKCSTFSITRVSFSFQVFFFILVQVECLGGI